ncbi:protein DEPP1 [Molossus molossus]|uniref:DEPP1 autophagy regulator n=1 Tax=Molossus molossus TaxID=27622 RepID=A0A7J8DNX2_MOLMO|nr:protein DEPP1 [Molossus molossus]KAF6424755.1 DEPP1 autophagy regulator [Molossus molossus]
MRSRLLLSVARLPTIWESWEEMLPGGPRQEPPASSSTDDYMRSICQLVQPTSVLDEAAARDRPSRPRRSARACAKSCPTRSLQDVTTHFSSQQPPPPGTSADDPLDWLFGQSQEKQPRCRGLPRRTGPSADRWGLHRQMESSTAQGGPKGKLCDARTPGHCLVRPLRDRHQSSWASWRPTQAAASPPSSRPSSVLRTLYLHLPVIHEL